MKLETGSSDSVISSFGPFNEVDQISASTRMTILTVLMKVYNQNLSSVPKESLRSVCRTVLKVIPCTVPSTLPPKSTDLYFTPTHNHSTNKTLSASSFMEMISKTGPRVHLTPDLLVELSYSVYFCLYNDVVLEGRRALDRIHSNALYHLYPNVLLVSSLGFRFIIFVFPNNSLSLVFITNEDDELHQEFSSNQLELPGKSGESSGYQFICSVSDFKCSKYCYSWHLKDCYY